MVIEIFAIALLGGTLGAKWLTNSNLSKLREEVAAAENDVKRSAGRHKTLQTRRSEVGRSLEQLRNLLESTEEECEYLESDLADIQKRNEEIEEQIASRK